MADNRFGLRSLPPEKRSSPDKKGHSFILQLTCNLGYSMFVSEFKKKEEVMKSEVKSTFQTDKEELKKIIAEVKAIVASIISLPVEKKVAVGKVSLWNSR